MDAHQPQYLMEAYRSVYEEQQTEPSDGLYEEIVEFLVNEGYAEDVEDAEDLIEELDDEEIDSILDEVTGRGYIEPVTGKHTVSSEVNRGQRPGSLAMGSTDNRTPYNKNRTKAKYVQSLPVTPENRRRLRRLNTGERIMMDRYRTTQNAAHAAAHQERQKFQESRDFDLYDLVLDHLLDEGYADSEENALKIMSNMSEEWVEDIIEGFKPTNYTVYQSNRYNSGRSRTAQRIDNQIKKLIKSGKEIQAKNVDFINRMQDDPEGRREVMEISKRNRSRSDARARRDAQRDSRKK